MGEKLNNNTFNCCFRGKLVILLHNIGLNLSFRMTFVMTIFYAFLPKNFDVLKLHNQRFQKEVTVTGKQHLGNSNARNIGDFCYVE